MKNIPRLVKLSLVVVLAIILAVAISSVASADGVPCIPGDANEDGVVDMGDVTTIELMILGYITVPTCGADANQDGTIDMGDVTTTELIILGYLVNLTVVSDGCCPIDVGAPVSQTVAAGNTQTFFNITKDTDVTVNADDSNDCCVFDSWSDGGAQSHNVHMDTSKSVAATCEWLTFDLTVDQSNSCCDVEVGEPINQTVLHNTCQTFEDIDCYTWIDLNAIPTNTTCCVFDSWSDGGAQNHEIHMDSDKTVVANCHWLTSDLYVNSIGCCFVEVWEDAVLVYTLDPGEQWSDVDVPCCTQVQVVAVPSENCECDDIELDGVSQGCDTASVHMDGSDHTFDVYCSEPAPPVPVPCCWCIYAAQWWPLPSAPPAAPTTKEYFALHCDEWLPAGHSEALGPPIGTHVIPDASWQQELTAYAGSLPNGYTAARGYGHDYAEWEALPDVAGMGLRGVERTNSILGMVYATGLGYWNSQDTLLNWKTRFNVNSGLGPITLFAVTWSITPYTGNAGWPFAVGNSWTSLGQSTITAPSWSYAECSAVETITVPAFPGGIECYRVESYGWTDDGDGIPEPGELKLSGTKWYNNDYGCPIKNDAVPGALYNGTETQDMVWYCTDPPFPPF